jgi:hypothetical protein
MNRRVRERTRPKRGSGAAGRFDASAVQSAFMTPKADEESLEMLDLLMSEI